MAVLHRILLSSFFLLFFAFPACAALDYIENLAEEFPKYVWYKDPPVEMDEVVLGQAEKFYVEMSHARYPFQYKFNVVRDRVFELMYPLSLGEVVIMPCNDINVVHFPVMGNVEIDKYLYDFAWKQYTKSIPETVEMIHDGSYSGVWYLFRVSNYIITKPSKDSHFMSVIFLHSVYRGGRLSTYATTQALNFDLKTGKQLTLNDFILDYDKFGTIEKAIITKLEKRFSMDEVERVKQGIGFDYALDYSEDVKYLDFIDGDILNVALDHNGLNIILGQVAFDDIILTFSKTELAQYGIRNDFWD